MVKVEVASQLTPDASSRQPKRKAREHKSSLLATGEVTSSTEADVPPPSTPVADEPSCLSAVTFQHFQKIMTLGALRPLEQSDLPPLPAADASEDIAKKFAANLKRTGKVSRALIATFWWPYFIAGLCKLPQDCCIFLSPMLLKILIALMQVERLPTPGGRPPTPGDCRPAPDSPPTGCRLTDH